MSMQFNSLKGAYDVQYDPAKPMALEMSRGQVSIRCDVFIDEVREREGHVVCGIAVIEDGYWFELHMEPPRRIEFWGNQILDHVAYEGVRGMN